MKHIIQKVLSIVMCGILVCAAIVMPSGSTAASVHEGTIYQVPDSDPMFAEVDDNSYARQYEIVFTPVRGSISEKELGLMHLREANTPDFIIDSFTDDDIAEFANAQKAIISVSYYAEAFDETSGEPSMVNISKDDFLQLEKQHAEEAEELLLPNLILSDG